MSSRVCRLIYFFDQKPNDVEVSKPIELEIELLEPIHHHLELRKYNEIEIWNIVVMWSVELSLKIKNWSTPSSTMPMKSFHPFTEKQTWKRCHSINSSKYGVSSFAIVTSVSHISLFSLRISFERFIFKCYGDFLKALGRKTSLIWKCGVSWYFFSWGALCIWHCLSECLDPVALWRRTLQKLLRRTDAAKSDKLVSAIVDDHQLCSGSVFRVSRD